MDGDKERNTHATLATTRALEYTGKLIPPSRHVFTARPQEFLASDSLKFSFSGFCPHRLILGRQSLFFASRIEGATLRRRAQVRGMTHQPLGAFQCISMHTQTALSEATLLP